MSVTTEEKLKRISEQEEDFSRGRFSASDHKYNMTEEMVTTRVLLVEDEVMHQQLFAAALKKTGRIEVRILDNGEHFHQVVQEFNPSLILLDWSFPVKGGIQLCRELRAYDQVTPVIMFSSNLTHNNVQIVYQAGAQDYISKPAKQEEIRRKVHSWLTQSLPRSASPSQKQTTSFQQR